MNKDLLKLILQYQKAVKSLFPRVAANLKVQLPISNIDWANINIEQRGKTPDGIHFFKHGFGIAMSDGEIRVDFDLGDKGQITGFDVGRLASFAKDNNVESPLRHWEDIQVAMKEAEAAGEIHYSGELLYYLDEDF